MRLLLSLLSVAWPAAAQGIITTIAGAEWVFPAGGIPALQAPISPTAEFDGPVAVDGAGNIFLADQQNRRIFKIDPRGILTIHAGDGINDNFGDGIPARLASLKLFPGKLVADSGGNLYVNQYYSIRKISTDGLISTPVTVNFPSEGLAVDRAGAIYYSEGSRVIKLLPNGNRVTLANMGVVSSNNSHIYQGLALDSGGNLYVADGSGRRVVKIATDGTSTTVAGGLDLLGLIPFRDGMPAVGAPIYVRGIHVDVLGNLYISSASFNFPDNYKVTPDGKIRRFGFFPSASDAAGNLYNGTNRLSPNAVTPTRYAGNGQYRALVPGGPAISTVLNQPLVVGTDGGGNLYITNITDGFRRPVARVDKDSNLTIVPGSDFRAQAVDRTGALYGFTSRELIRLSGNGPVIRTPLSSTLDLIFSVAVDDAGKIYVASSLRVYRISVSGQVTHIAGNGGFGFTGDGGAAIEASFGTNQQSFLQLAVDRAGNVYISDRYNFRVRKIDVRGVITTVAGTGRSARSPDQVPAAQATILPGQLATDRAGNLYIEDAYQIRKLTPDGMLTLVAGNGSSEASGDGGPATQAGLGNIGGFAVDDAGNIYLGDYANHRVRMVLAAAPVLRAPPAVELAAVSGGPPSIERTVSLSTPVPGLAFTAASVAPWLKITPARGTLPASLTFRGDPAALEPGVHTATVTVASPHTNPNRVTITVTFTVSEAGPSRLQLDREAVSLAAVRRGGVVTASFRVVNAGGGLFDFLVATSTIGGGPWLAVGSDRGRASAASPAAVTLRADPAALAPGTYSGRIEVASATTGETAALAVTLSVTESPYSMVLSQTGLTFVAVLGGGRVPAQSFGVLNAGSGVMSWTIGATTFSGGSNWLSVTPTSGATDAQSLRVPRVEAGVRAAGLAPGEYHAQIEVRSAAENSPQYVSVLLRVLPAGSDPGPRIRPTGLIFTDVAGGAGAASQEVLIANLAAGARSYRSGKLTLDGADWIVYTPPTATMRKDDWTQMLVRADSRGLGAGIRRGTLTLLFDDGTIRTIGVLLLLVAPGGAKSPAAEAGCGQLLPVFNAPETGFAAQAGVPVAVEAQIADDCGQPLAAGSVVATFSNGDPPLPLVSLKDGRWSATWVPRNPAAEVKISVVATGNQALGSEEITGRVPANPGVPLIGAAVSAASLGRNAPLALGGLVTIFGQNLAERTTLAPALPLPLELGGVTVALGAQKLPLLLASPGQINAIVPFETPARVRQQLIVRRGALATSPEEVTIAEAQPAVFTLDGSGTGQGLIFRVAADGATALADRSNPGTAGEYLVIYCAGLGAVEPAVTAGAASPESPPAVVQQRVTVTIGGVDALVTFAGLAPGFTGVYQVNAQAPEGLKPGDAVTVVITAGGQQSPPVTMAMR